MATTLRIKRRLTGGSSGAPSALKGGELAFNEVDGKLYYGSAEDGGGDAQTILQIGVTNPAAQSDTLTIDGDVDGSGALNSTITLTLDTVMTAGTYTKMTVDGKGRVIAEEALAAGDIPTLTASKISDFDTQVRTSRLDQMAAPTAAVSMNSQKITNLADPTSAQDAATKAYVDAARSGLDVKASVRAAASSDEALTSGNASATVDGVTLADGDRVLLTGQTAGAENGIYVYTDEGGSVFTWVRATDADSNAEVTAGMFTFVTEGTSYADTGWVLTTDDAITLGTTSLAFTQFSGTGAITAGTGLTKNGAILNVGDAGKGVQVNADDVEIDASEIVGDGLKVGASSHLLSVDASAIAGAGLEDDGSENLRISAAAAGADLTGGAGSALAVGGTTNRISVSADAVDIDAAYVGQASITTLGTIATGLWQGTTIAVGYGGTGITSYTTGDLVYASGASTLAKLGLGTAGQVLKVNTGATAPEWADELDGGTF